MISEKQYEDSVARASGFLKAAGIVITPEEHSRFEVADFGLGELEKTGLEIITYVNTDRCCAKEIIMFPRQTCPEHWHPTSNGVPGKEETFRIHDVVELEGETYYVLQGEDDEERVLILRREGESLITLDADEHDYVIEQLEAMEEEDEPDDEDGAGKR